MPIWLVSRGPSKVLSYLWEFWEKVSNGAVTSPLLKQNKQKGGLEKAELSQGLCDLTPGGVLPKLSDGAADGLSSSQAMDSGSATPMVEKA